MSDKAYEANYNSALTFLKYNQTDPAIETLMRALSQVPGDEINAGNAVYLSILAVLSFLLLQKSRIGDSDHYVEQGLAVKKDHADLLFVKSLILLDYKSYDEMLEAIINYLLAMGKEDSEKFGYRYTHEQALKEIYTALIPAAYGNAVYHEKIRDIVEKLCKASDNERLKKALDVMIELDNSRTGPGN